MEELPESENSIDQKYQLIEEYNRLYYDNKPSLKAFLEIHHMFKNIEKIEYCGSQIFRIIINQEKYYYKRSLTNNYLRYSMLNMSR